MPADLRRSHQMLSISTDPHAEARRSPLLDFHPEARQSSIVAQKFQGNSSPDKPWDRAISSSGPTPFKPQSSGSTSNVVEASGIAKPAEIVPKAGGTMQVNRNVVARPVPSRPWTQNYGNSYNGYGSNMNYNSGYNPYGGSSLYGNTSSYGGGYGGSYGGSGMYGGGNMYSNNYGGNMYSNNYGGMMGGPMAGPYGNQDPNDAASPPGFWMSFLKMMGGVAHVFGRIAILVDQNTQAFHMFMSALLQLFDRSGLLYGELARFVLRILGIRSLSRKRQPGSGELRGPDTQQIAGPTKMYDSVWPGNDPM